MYSYIIRRLLLIIPTFIGTTLLVFVILQYVPGNPFEKAKMELMSQKMQGEGGEVSSSGADSDKGVSLGEEVIEQLRRQYGIDKPIMIRYLIWLGAYPRLMDDRYIELDYPYQRVDVELVERYEISNPGSTQFKKGDIITPLEKKEWEEKDSSLVTVKKIYALQKWLKVEKHKKTGEWTVIESGVGTDFPGYTDQYEELPLKPKHVKVWYIADEWGFDSITEKKGLKTAYITKHKYSGIFQGDLGNSIRYNDKPVSELFSERIGKSLYFGIIGFILSYFVCIPLGIAKAVKSGSKFDAISSTIVFIGYSIPGFVLGATLLLYFGDIFPRGWDSGIEARETMTNFELLWDRIRHTILPVMAYAVGSFATLTVLMKNSVIENLSQDYVRTAFSKGLSEKRVIFFHAVRNSLIPIATGIGSLIGIFLTGSYLIEKTFNIDGIGMLSFRSILESDFPVVMGFIVLGTLVRLFGNLISDLCYAAIDPRIRFK